MSEPFDALRLLRAFDSLLAAIAAEPRVHTFLPFGFGLP